jgi:hypothetical protein
MKKKSEQTDALAKRSGPRRSASPPLLFLDFDGVLHRGGSYVTPAGPVSTAPGRIQLFEYAEVLEQLLQPYPELRVVLSTDWVVTFSFEAALAALPLESLRDRVIGATFDPSETLLDAEGWRTLMRGVQIRGYLHRHPCRRWLAIDDRNDGFQSDRQRLILCQESVGLGDPDVQALFARRLEALHR